MKDARALSYPFDKSIEIDDTNVFMIPRKLLPDERIPSSPLEWASLVSFMPNSCRAQNFFAAAFAAAGPHDWTLADVLRQPGLPRDSMAQWIALGLLSLQSSFIKGPFLYEWMRTNAIDPLQVLGIVTSTYVSKDLFLRARDDAVFCLNKLGSYGTKYPIEQGCL
jgi:hypothetical protein